VLKTFPHDSADTSKTGSNRKDGALYGFLAAVDVSRALSLLVLSVFKSHVPPTDLNSHCSVSLHRTAPAIQNDGTLNRVPNIYSLLGRCFRSGQVSIHAQKSADWEACTAQPPVPEVPQVPSASVPKYTCEAPARVDVLSNTTPLAPPGADALAAVVVPALIAAPEVTSNDMMHPAAAGQEIGTPVTAEFCTLMKIQSFAPPTAFGLSTSVTGEQVKFAVPRAGPAVGALKAPAVTVI
jgi:hypothetical protein